MSTWISDQKLPRRTLLGAGAAGLAAMATGCSLVSTPADAQPGRPDKDPAPGRRTQIEIYSNWGSKVGAGMVACARAFEEYQDEIAVRVTFAPDSGSGTGIPQKLLTAIAGGQAPDVAFCDASVAPAWTQLGMMTDLTPYFERDGIRLEDFYPPCAASMAYRDRIWSIPWDADANFPFFWNKGLFEKCGLDPDKPPQTIDDIDACAREIDRIEGGLATQVGIVPWSQYGGANSILTWGYAFGGTFWKEGTNQVTPTDEGVVAALEWMVRSAKRIGGPDALSIAPPSLSAHPFSTGRLGMTCLVTPNLVEVAEINPDLDIGSTLLPYHPPGGTKSGQGAWLGGWSGFVPRSARHPDAAWEFLKWFAVSDEGTSAQWKNIGYPVGYAKAPVNETIKNDPVAGVYYETLVAMEHTRPLVTVNSFYNQQLEEKVELATYGQVTPALAMQQVQDLTMREADRFERVG